MKSGLFSFIGDEFENLFQYSDLFLPGIEKIMGIYYSRKDDGIRIVSRQRDREPEMNYDEILRKRENIIMIQKYRGDEHSFTWVKKEELPFDIPDKTKIISPNLFSELENIILILRFKNETDHLSDLLLIHFNKNLGNFGLNKSDKVLSPDNKLVIGHLLYYQFKSILQINNENKALLKALNNVVRSVIHENNSLKDQYNQVRVSYGENLISMAKSSLQDLSDEFGRTYSLTDDAIEKLRNYKGNLKNLPNIMRNAVIFTENLLFTDDDEPAAIQSYSLDFDSYQVDDKKEQFTRKIDSRQSRAMLLLDRLERACSTLKSRGGSLIGSKVGQAMDPPISAPAITDALGKNRMAILQVMAKYPEKWEIIRNEFKPLINQLRKKDSEDEKVESA